MVVEFGEEAVYHLLHVASEKRESRRENERPTDCAELGV